MRSFEVSPPPVRRPACLVRVGRGALRAIAADLRKHLPRRTLVVISDATVARLHAAALAKRLSRAGLPTHLLSFPPGERSKTRKTKAALEDRLFELGVGRDCAIVAMGGGVTGDLAGFVGATWQRGVPVVQVPTSLLAMVDSALGGKTGVDLPGGKNLVGTFQQPVALYADLDVLETLPRRQLVLGFAEMVKTAAIGDASFFRWLEENAAALGAAEPRQLEMAVARCLELKGRVVVRDERESGRRAILNFGHTVAHAIEAASDYSIPHGRAVAIGLVVESRLAVDAVGLSKGSADRIARLLATLGLVVRWPRSLDMDRVIAATRRDKKARAGKAHYALPVALGRMLPGDSVTVPVSERMVVRSLLDLRDR